MPATNSSDGHVNRDFPKQRAASMSVGARMEFGIRNPGGSSEIDASLPESESLGSDLDFLVPVTCVTETRKSRSDPNNRLPRPYPWGWAENQPGMTPRSLSWL